jgi:hypothetical protein
MLSKVTFALIAALVLIPASNASARHYNKNYDAYNSAVVSSDRYSDMNEEIRFDRAKGDIW